MIFPRFFRSLAALLVLTSPLACDPKPHAEAPQPAGCGPGMVELESGKSGHFCLDQYAITVADYQECVGRAQCSVADESKGCKRDDLMTHDKSVNCVDFAQADAFCKWRKKRLPTQDELLGVPFSPGALPISTFLPEWTSSPAGAGQRFVVSGSNPMARQPMTPMATPENSHNPNVTFRCAR